MEIVKNYAGTEENLYSITEGVCSTCTEQLKDFSAFKSKYTPAYLDAILGKADAAKAIPNQEQRQGMQTDLRNVVLSANETCCADFMGLMKYLEDGFETADWDNKKKIAGNGYYTAASHESFQDTKTMMGMAVDFMKNYPTELATGGMPASYPATLTEGQSVFLKALAAFLGYKVMVENETATKLTANNDVYASVQSILRDGKYIYRKNAPMRKQFSYAAWLKKIRKPGATGMRIAVNDDTSLLSIENAVIYVVQGDKTFNSDKKGIILAELAAGKYTFTLTANNYTPVEGSFETHTGVMHRLYIAMKKIASTTTEATEKKEE